MAILALGLPGVASAEPATVRVAVVSTGKGAGDVVASLKGALPSNVTVVDGAAVSAALKGAGASKALHVPLDPPSIDAFRHAASAQGVDAFVVLSVRASARAREVVVEVFDVSQAGPYAEQPVHLGARPSATDGAKLFEAAHALAQVRPGSPAPSLPSTRSTPVAASKAAAANAAPPPAPPAATVAAQTAAPPSAPSSDAPADDKRAGDLAYALASVTAGVDLGTRNFSYHDGVSSNLRPYSGAVAPAFAVHGEIYPFATTRSAFAQGIGLQADYRASIGLSSQPAGGSAVDTSWASYDLLLRYRIRLGSDAPPTLGIFAGYAREEFVFATPSSSYPAAAYPAFRAGLDVRFPFGSSSISASGDYDVVVRAEDVGQNFRSPSAGGVDASVAYAYRVTKLVELYAMGGMTRYFYSFTPVPGDAWVAGGAVDQMFHGQLGVRATY